MISVTNPSGPNRRGAQRCSSTPIIRTPDSRSGPAAAIRSAVARIAIELTVCHDTPSSAAIAEMVVRAIINRRNTYRAHRRVVEARGAASLPKSWLNNARPHSAVVQRYRGTATCSTKWVASDRQISQRPGHGVAVAALTSTSRAPWIAGHRRAEDRRHLLVDRGVGDGHAQLDRAHDRVGNNRRRERSSLRHGSPRWRGGRVSATRIVTHRGPTSSKRHGPRTRISANHPRTLVHEEPVFRAIWQWPRR